MVSYTRHRLQGVKRASLRTSHIGSYVCIQYTEYSPGRSFGHGESRASRPMFLIGPLMCHTRHDPCSGSRDTASRVITSKVSTSWATLRCAGQPQSIQAASSETDRSSLRFLFPVLISYTARTAGLPVSKVFNPLSMGFRHRNLVERLEKERTEPGVSRSPTCFFLFLSCYFCTRPRPVPPS